MPNLNLAITKIETIEQLRDRLKIALKIELSTIPLYLYAMYSIKDSLSIFRTDILRVVSEEMLHLSLVGNLLLAIGGEPKLYDRDVIPVYNEDSMLFGINLQLQKYSKEQIKTFKKIERPKENDSPHPDKEYHTIGKFYEDIQIGLNKVFEFDPKFKSPQADRQYYDEIFSDPVAKAPIRDLESARKAINLIIEQGEGYEGAEGHSTDHYDVFEHHESAVSAGLDVYDMPTNPKVEEYHKYQGEKIFELANVFNMAYCYLLKMIESYWTESGDTKRQKIKRSINVIMKSVMRPIATLLLQQELRQPSNVKGPTVAAPTFEYYEFASQTPAKEMSKKIADVSKLYKGSQYSDKLTTIQLSIDNLY